MQPLFVDTEVIDNSLSPLSVLVAILYISLIHLLQTNVASLFKCRPLNNLPCYLTLDLIFERFYPVILVSCIVKCAILGAAFVCYCYEIYYILL